MGHMKLELEQLKKILPTTKNLPEWLNALNKICPDYKINTKRRMAAFLGQCCHESGDFKSVEENLNYSARGLMATFGRYFTPSSAKAYARQPEKIANRVYANRMGNGLESSGDGWQFRGRGLIQLTGKYNYAEFAKHIGRSLDEVIEYLNSFEGCVHSACWFWRSRELNELADRWDLKQITYKINGGYNGYNDRVQKSNKIFTNL